MAPYKSKKMKQIFKTFKMANLKMLKTQKIKI